MYFNKITIISLFVLSVFATGSLRAQQFTTPPTTPVRTMAEWEELDALVIQWVSYPAILTQIVRAASDECRVIVCCPNQDTMTSVQNRLIANNINMDRVEFLVSPANTVWIRDYGPQCVYANGVDSLLLVDWIYNRNRPADNSNPIVLGQHEGLPVYSTTVAPYDLVNTGGNYMCDGMGQAFASELIYRNNDQIANGEPSGSSNDIYGTTAHTEATIDNILQEFMGIQTMIKLPELPYDGIHHIDMHIKLLDEETLLVGKYPDGVSDGPQIEANLQYVLSNYMTSFGRPYKVVRVPMPPYQGGYPPFSGQNVARYPTYVNSFFVNKTIVMPIYNNALDAAARDTFEKYLPGYEVFPINCNGMINAGGAVHCITREIGVRDPLLIQHAAQRNLCNDSLPNGYPIEATIRHRSGVGSAEVWWNAAPGNTWQSVSMIQGTDNKWAANLPLQAANSKVSYYIKATAQNGKELTRPITAPEGYWTLQVAAPQCASPTDEPTNSQLLLAYPNPASAITCVPVHFNVASQGTLRVVDALGRTVQVIHAGQFPAGPSNWFIHADKYTAGTYAIILESVGQRSVQRLIVR
jgi:agmatine deiminase